MTIPKLFSPKLIRYVLVGGTAYVLEISSLYVLVHGFGFSSLKAVSISFWVGFITAFVLQKLVTFKNYEKQSGAVTKQLLMYGLLVGWNYSFTLIMVKMLADQASIIVIRTLVIALVTSWNFFIYHVIFKVQNGHTKPGNRT